jgi:hypothetical protein
MSEPRIRTNLIRQRDSVAVWKREFFTEDVTIGDGWSIRGETLYLKP